MYLNKLFLILLFVSLIFSNLISHPKGPRGTIKLNWKLPNINAVYSAGWGFSFGLEGSPRKGFPVKSIVDKKICYSGSFFSFDIEDKYLYDIDFDVKLNILMRDKGAEHFYIYYDKALVPMSSIECFGKPIGNGWYKAEVLLKQPRFINRGHSGSDFSIIASSAAAVDVNVYNILVDTMHTLKIASIDFEFVRTKQSKKIEYSNLDIIVKDENDKKTPFRFGIYDSNDRIILASNDALKFENAGDKVNFFYLRTVGERIEPWPSKGRYFYYSNGQYRTKIKPGEYTLIISKGNEYLNEVKKIIITPNEVNKFEITLKRWINSPKNSWYSGDDHIHMSREKKDTHNDSNILAITKAEDINTSNILVCGNPGDIYYPQFDFGKNGSAFDGNFSLIPGVEDPRTVHHGHSISLNIKKHILNKDNYFLYHKVFEEYQKQGGLTGYAHVDRNWFNAEYGIALDFPFSLVNFLEIMQFGEIKTDIYYDLLNLGFKVIPTAGSDFPYLEQVGGVRSYVKIENGYNAQKWFDNLKKGITYVTNHPILNFSINNNEMGSKINVKKGDILNINAEVNLEKDIDTISYCEIIKNGKVFSRFDNINNLKNIKININDTINNGSWFALRTYGKKYAMAHTASIYINVDGKGHIQKDLAPKIVEKLNKYIDEFIKYPINEIGELEYWAAEPNLQKRWLKSLPELTERAEKAKLFYTNLLKQE